MADKGYYSADQTKKCVDEGIITYVPEPERKAASIPQPPFYETEFRYDREKDIYTCPAGSPLTFRRETVQDGKVMRIYQGQECLGCVSKPRCASNPQGRIISRWEHEEILEAMRDRVKSNRRKLKMRQWLSQHPFGTIKRSFNQGYMLMKGLAKVRGEMSLTMLAYNMKRAINILGIGTLITAVRQCPTTLPAS